MVCLRIFVILLGVSLNTVYAAEQAGPEEDQVYCENWAGYIRSMRPFNLSRLVESQGKVTEYSDLPPVPTLLSADLPSKFESARTKYAKLLTEYQVMKRERSGATVDSRKKQAAAIQKKISDLNRVYSDAKQAITVHGVRKRRCFDEFEKVLSDEEDTRQQEFEAQIRANDQANQEQMQQIRGQLYGCQNDYYRLQQRCASRNQENRPSNSGYGPAIQPQTNVIEKILDSAAPTSPTRMTAPVESGASSGSLDSPSDSGGGGTVIQINDGPIRNTPPVMNESRTEVWVPATESENVNLPNPATVQGYRNSDDTNFDRNYRTNPSRNGSIHRQLPRERQRQPVIEDERINPNQNQPRLAPSSTRPNENP